MKIRTIKRCVSRTNTELNNHKQFINRIISDYRKESTEIDIKENSGIFSSNYILNERQKLKDKYFEIIAKEKNALLIRLNSLNDLTRQEFDSFFTGDITKGFADKITAFKTVGVDLSDKEFSLLYGQAKSYSDFILLETFAKSRTTSERLPKVDKNGNIEVENVETGNGYIERKVNVPNIERSYTALENFINSVLNFAKYYYGDNAELKEVTKDVPIFAIANAPNYYDRNEQAKFIETIDGISECLPESKEKTVLTDDDRKLIDALVDPAHPLTAQVDVQKYAEVSPYFENLFSLDDRYSKYVNEV